MATTIGLRPQPGKIHRFGPDGKAMRMRLHGKTALITGAARGIGLEFARAYIAEGATVTLADINAAAHDAGRGRTWGQRPVPIQMDVDAARTASTPALPSAIARMGQHRYPDQQRGPFLDLRPSSRSRGPTTTGSSPSTSRARCSTLQAVARHMIARGQGGTIINMASQAGRRGEGAGRRLLRHQGRGDQPDPIRRAWT